MWVCKNKNKKCDKMDTLEYPKQELGGCKFVIYKYVFCWLLFVPNLIVIIFNLLYHVFIVWFDCKDCVLERERVWRLKQFKPEEFLWVSRD